VLRFIETEVLQLALFIQGGKFEVGLNEVS